MVQLASGHLLTGCILLRHVHSIDQGFGSGLVRGGGWWIGLGLCGRFTILGLSWELSRGLRGWLVRGQLGGGRSLIWRIVWNQNGRRREVSNWWASSRFCGVLHLFLCDFVDGLVFFVDDHLRVVHLCTRGVPFLGDSRLCWARGRRGTLFSWRWWSANSSFGGRWCFGWRWRRRLRQPFAADLTGILALLGRWGQWRGHDGVQRLSARRVFDTGHRGLQLGLSFDRGRCFLRWRFWGFADGGGWRNFWLSLGFKRRWGGFLRCRRSTLRGCHDGIFLGGFALDRWRCLLLGHSWWPFWLECRRRFLLRRGSCHIIPELILHRVHEFLEPRCHWVVAVGSTRRSAHT
eukprot:m.191450 g.191450  ORF g.191450 m.191450 type:complete len:347 (-) comp24923_c0_seq1:217-1257(-)